jgi:hypothetical protein
MPSSVGNQKRHIYGMFSGAAIKVTSNLHDPMCTTDRGGGGGERIESSACWQREAISLSEHLTGVTQVLHPSTSCAAAFVVTSHTSRLEQHLTPHPRRP